MFEALGDGDAGREARRVVCLNGDGLQSQPTP
jgi:hypothetical protein